MRHALFAIGLGLITGPAYGFEIETQKRYEAAAPAGELRILSTADNDVFDPILRAFQLAHPGLTLQYDVASSADVMSAIYDEGAPYDLAISSAMDLQTKLANDGYVQAYQSDATQALPGWAKWRDELFAFTQEPAVLVISKSAFDGLDIPRTREDLINLLRDNEPVFRGRVGTYDVRSSGFGYLVATQDSRNTESFWRLTELMGRLDTQLYCCSTVMIEAVASGELALAYNALGSYATSRLEELPGIEIVELDDVTSVMLRTALIPRNASNIDAAGLMIDFLAQLGTRPDLTAQTGLPPIAARTGDSAETQRPIRLGPGLLVFLDRMRRETFLRSWTDSIVQD